MIKSNKIRCNRDCFHTPPFKPLTPIPVYDFQSESGKTISVLVRLEEPDKARQVQIQDGVKYKRVYSAPLAARDTAKGTRSSKDFHRCTEGKNLKVGDLWDMSKEMSQDRADRNGGLDPVREKSYEEHEKKFGKPHEDVIKRRVEAKTSSIMKTMGIKIQD